MREKPEQEQRGGESLLSKIEIYGTREGGLIEAMVPIELIDRTEVAVDHAHVRELAESMAAESSKGIASGQLTPVLLGLVPGRDKFSIIDGFHRDSALQMAGKDKVFSTIRPNTTEEEIDDLRILTANSHSAVTFARIHDWVSTAWNKSPWSDRITAAQAFSLANNKKMNGRYMGLSEDEATTIRNWALDKCERWHMSAATIWSTMSTAQVADPELVKEVRARASGHELVTLTPQHLREIATAYPDEFQIQRALANVATSQNLTVMQTKKVLEMLRGITDRNEAISTIELTDWAAVFEEEKSQKKTRNRGVKPKQSEISERSLPKNESRSLSLKYMLARITIARLEISDRVLRGHYVAMPEKHSDPSPFTIDIKPFPQLNNAARPTVTEADSENFINRFEEVEPKLVEVFMKQTNATEDQAHRAVQTIGRRISNDMTKGALRYVDFSRIHMYDELLRTCLADEINQFQHGSAASISSIDSEITNIDATVAMSVLPTLEQKAQTGLVMGGILGIGAHSIAQVISMSHVQTRQVIEQTHHRLNAAERIYQRSIQPAVALEA